MSYKFKVLQLTWKTVITLPQKSRRQEWYQTVCLWRGWCLTMWL